MDPESVSMEEPFLPLVSLTTASSVIYPFLLTDWPFPPVTSLSFRRSLKSPAVPRRPQECPQSGDLMSRFRCSSSIPIHDSFNRIPDLGVGLFLVPAVDS